MFEIFEYSFMVRAFIGGLIIALILPLLGNFLVARRYSLIADSLAHVSLAGVGAALLAEISPLFFAIPAAITGAVIMEWLRQNRRLSGDVGLAIVMSAGLAIAVVLSNMAQKNSSDFAAFLFGSVSTTTQTDLWVLGAAAVATIFIASVWYRTLLHISFDEDSARISGYRVTLLNYLLVITTAIVTVLSIRIVGGLLISALLVIPVVAAAQISKSFLQNIIFSIIFAALAIIIGLYVAFYAGLAAGGAIVLTALALLICAIILRR